MISSILKEVAFHGGDIDMMGPEIVCRCFERNSVGFGEGRCAFASSTDKEAASGRP
jgi:hypothetical protein